MQHPQPHRSNAAGIAGFVLSLVGFIACGFLSPIGLIFSAIGLRREPRGLAIAGLVLGILGSLWLFVFLFVIGGVGALLAALGLAAVAASERLEIQSDGERIGRAVESYQQQTGATPVSLSDVAGLAPHELTDPWGNAYTIELTLDGYVIMSVGPDGTPDSWDDIRAYPATE